MAQMNQETFLQAETETAKETEIKGKTEDMKDSYDGKKFMQPGQTQKRLLESGYSIRRKNRDDMFKTRRAAKEHTENSGQVNIEKFQNTSHCSSDQIAELQKKKFTILDLDQLIGCLNSGDNFQQYVGAVGIRKILSTEVEADKDPNIQKIIDINIVQKLIQFLAMDERPDLQFEAAWSLTNMASGKHEHAQSISEKGAIPLFARLLYSPHTQIQEQVGKLIYAQALWALGNFAGDSVDNRKLVINTGAIKVMSQLLLESIKNKAFQLIKNGSWALSNIIRGKPTPPFSKLKPAVPAICQTIINHDDPEVLSETLWALTYMSDGAGKDVGCIFETGILKRLLSLLLHSSLSIAVGALRTLGNLVTGDDHYTIEVINAGALHQLNLLLSNPKPAMRREAAWAISNFTASSSNVLNYILNTDILEKLEELAQNDEIDVQREAIWAIANTTAHGKAYQIAQIVQRGLLEILLFGMKMSDQRIQAVSIQALENVFKKGKEFIQDGKCSENPFSVYFEQIEGIDTLESLQYHQNQSIYEIALSCLENYFVEDTDGLIFSEDHQQHISL